MGITAWLAAGYPGGWEGMAVCAAIAVPAWPLLLLLIVFGVPGAIRELVPPRRVRAWWRHRRPREDQRSSRIPALLRRAVMAADRYRCIACRTGLGLQVDHMTSWAAGGLSVLWNLAVLCGPCNRLKWDDRYGRRGRAILAAERRARLNPLRWLRAARTLGWI